MSKKRAQPGKSHPTPESDKATTRNMAEDNTAMMIEWSAQILAIAHKLGIQNDRVQDFWLTAAQRNVILAATSLSKLITSKLANGASSFSTIEIVRMMNALAEQLPNVKDGDRIPILLVIKHLLERLGEGIVGSVEPKESTEPQVKGRKQSKKTTSPKIVYQFKVSLKDSKPPIWRRFQVTDCTLDKLHEHIQTAMGWTNSHLHRFEIGAHEYADPMLMEEDMEEFGYIDSTRTKISKVLPKSGSRFNFYYEYDFGDGWEHDILFEGCPPPEKGIKYPICLEGARACPPEDVGGIHGFYEYLKAMANPRHKRHKEYLRWNGPYDPAKFDAEIATDEMRKGLPDWRTME